MQQVGPTADPTHVAGDPRRIPRDGRDAGATHGARGRTALPPPHKGEGSRKWTPLRLQARQRRPSVTFTARWFAAILLAAITSAVLILAPRPQVDAATTFRTLDDIAVAAGLGIDEVTVTGHRFTADRDILDSLDLANVRTMTALKSTAVKARIERLPWIATATITRVYPGRIDVAVTERFPFAVWLNGTSASLVDETGRILAAVAPTHAPGLPRLAGEGAPAAASALFQTLAHVPDIANRLTRATRVAGRRWSLDLTDGLRVELPADGEAGALAALVADRAAPKLLAARNTIIDLRVPREIAVRAAGAS